MAKKDHRRGGATLLKLFAADRLGAESNIGMYFEQIFSASDMTLAQAGSSEAAFKAIGLWALFATEDDTGMDWERCFALDE